MFRFTIVDAIWLLLLTAMAACRYADRDILATSVRNWKMESR